MRWPELATMARTAEEIGLDSIWVGDHLLYRDRGPGPVAPWEAWSQLAALAAITTRVELGPLVASASFHNPAMIAAKANAIDEISGGRGARPDHGRLDRRAEADAGRPRPIGTQRSH